MLYFTVLVILCQLYIWRLDIKKVGEINLAKTKKSGENGSHCNSTPTMYNCREATLSKRFLRLPVLLCCWFSSYTAEQNELIIKDSGGYDNTLFKRCFSNDRLEVKRSQKAGAKWLQNSAESYLIQHSFVQFLGPSIPTRALRFGQLCKKLQLCCVQCLAINNYLWVRLYNWFGLLKSSLSTER